MTIDSFRGQHDFLSNFYPSRIEVFITGPDGPEAEKELVTAKTVEHAFQALKVDPNHADANAIQRYVLKAQSPNSAKLRGRAVPLHPHWDAIRTLIMDDLIYFKFAEQPMRQRLVDTAPHDLIEGNTWGDEFWGVNSHTGRGENHLGKILMKWRKIFVG